MIFFFVLLKVSFLEIFVILFGLLFFVVGWALLVAPGACKTMWTGYLKKSDSWLRIMGFFHLLLAIIVTLLVFFGQGCLL